MRLRSSDLARSARPAWACSELRHEIALVAGPAGRRDRERDARHPGGPARVGVDPQPLDREQEQSPGPVDQGIPASSGERAPDADQAHGEPAEVGRAWRARAPPARRSRPPRSSSRYRRCRCQSSDARAAAMAAAAAAAAAQGSGSAAGARCRPGQRTIRERSSAPIPPRTRRDGTCPDRGSCLGCYGWRNGPVPANGPRGRPGPGMPSGARRCLGSQRRPAGRDGRGGHRQGGYRRPAIRWLSRGRATARAPRWSAASAAAGPATCRTTEPITCGGGPPAPSRNDGKKISRPTAWADRADGSTEPSSTPRLTKATEPERQRGRHPPPRRASAGMP